MLMYYCTFVIKTKHFMKQIYFAYYHYHNSTVAFSFKFQFDLLYGNSVDSVMHWQHLTVCTHVHKLILT